MTHRPPAEGSADASSRSGGAAPLPLEQLQGLSGAAADAPLQALLRALAEGPMTVGVYDADDWLRYANRAYRERFLRGHHGAIRFVDILRLGFRGGFGVRIERGDLEAFLADLLPRRRSRAQRAFQVDTVDGHWLWMTEILLADGWLLSIGADITPVKHAEHRLREAHAAALHASRTDALTGLPNRRHMMELLQQALDEHARTQQPLCVALIDLDAFKSVNDRYGHDTGDEVLRYFAEYCTQQLRPQDRFGRLGGEEFVLLLPGLALARALEVLDGLRAGIPSLRPRSAAETTLTYTFSAGLAEARADERLVGLLQRTDRALYMAKQGGRNRVLPAI